MREISFDFHRMEAICDELALYSDMLSRQVLNPLHDAYSVLDPEIADKVRPRFHSVIERASRLRNEQNDLAALIVYASNAYKKNDREAVSNLAEINEQANHMLDGVQNELRGVANGRTTHTSGSFAIVPDGYARDVSHASLRELGKVASFEVEKDKVDYSFTASDLSGNQATAYDAASPLHNFSFPKFDFNNEKMSGEAHEAGKFVVPAIVASGAGGAFYSLHLQNKASSGVEQKRISGKSITSDKRVKTMTKAASKGASNASLLAGGLSVLNNHSSIAFNARDKQNVSANTVLLDADEVGLPRRANDRRVVYASLAALGFFTFSMLTLPEFINIENFHIIVDTVSRDVSLKDYYKNIRNRSLIIDDFVAEHSSDIPVSARYILEDEFAALNLQKSDVQIRVPPREEADELNMYAAENGMDSEQPHLHALSQIDELEAYSAQNSAAPPFSKRAILDDEFAALNLQKSDVQIKVPPRIKTEEIIPFILQESIDPQIVVPPAYAVEPLMRVIFPARDNIPWMFSLKYDPNFTTWMERFDIRVRILPPDYRYIREFVPLANDGRFELHRDMLAVGKLAGFAAQKREAADVTGNTNRISVQKLDKFEIIGDTSEILWKHLVRRDADISEPQMKKLWAEILGGKFFTSEELDAGNRYERKLYDSVFEFLVKSVYVPELKKLNVSAASHTAAMMNKAAAEDIENPAYVNYTETVAPAKKVNVEEMLAYSAQHSNSSQVIASKAAASEEPLDEIAGASAETDEGLNVTAKRAEASELTSGVISENVGGPSAFGANNVKASDMDAAYATVLPTMAKASGARVDVNESELSSQFTQWSVRFTGNTYTGTELSYVQSASAYLGAKTGAKAVDARDLEPVDKNSAKSIVINDKTTQELKLEEAEPVKNEPDELTDQQIQAILSALVGATIGTGLVFSAKKAAGALRNGGSYSLPEHVSFESLQKSATAITGEMLVSLVKHGYDLGSLATLADAVCNSIWTQGGAVSAVVTYTSVAVFTAYKIYNIYKGKG